MIKKIIALCLLASLLVGCGKPENETSCFDISRDDFVKELQSDGLLECEYIGQENVEEDNETAFMYTCDNILGNSDLMIYENSNGEMNQIILMTNMEGITNHLIASGKIAEIIIPDVNLSEFSDKYKIAELEHDDIREKEGNVVVFSRIKEGQKAILFKAE